MGLRLKPRKSADSRTAAGVRGHKTKTLVAGAALAAFSSLLASAAQPVAADGVSAGPSPVVVESGHDLNSGPATLLAFEDRPVVYLTFDGGPGPRTPEFLDVLDRWNGRATFFVTGSHTRANPAMLNQIVARGHVLANHTWDHPDMSTLSRYEAMVQLRTTQRIVASSAGITMTCWRPPFGETNDEVQGWADEVGLTNSGWLRNGRWTVDTIDWDRGYEFVLGRLNTVQANDVVLMHGGMNPDAEDLRALVTWLEANGDQYRLEALPGCEPSANTSDNDAAKLQSPTTPDGDSARTQTTGPGRPAPTTQRDLVGKGGSEPTELAFVDNSASGSFQPGSKQWYTRQRVSIFLNLVTRSIDHAPSLAGSS